MKGKTAFRHCLSFFCTLILFVCVLGKGNSISAAGTLSGINNMYPSSARFFSVQLPNVSINLGNSSGTGEDGEQATDDSTATTVQLLMLVALLSLAPSIIIVMTCFTRIIISLHFVRSALGTQQIPPNQVLIGLALFLTLFKMSPTIEVINQTAWQPLSNGEITQEAAISAALIPLRGFMFAEASKSDIALFSDLSGTSRDIESLDDIPTTVLIPAFILGEVTQGFKIGFAIYLTFIVVDMVVASVLMAMGMMMLPPAMISLPFKLMVFVLVGGWNFIIEEIFKSFN